MLEKLIWFWDQLIALDHQLFLLINGKWTNPIFDRLLVLFRTPLFWTPLYLFLLVVAIKNFKSRAVAWVLSLGITAGLMDFMGNKLIKHTVQRLRPCNDPDFSPQVRLLIDHCGTGFSFISNHAANHFAMATFIFATMAPVFGKARWLFFVWAASVAYAQVYVGVHYPSDVLFGALTGMIFGFITASIYNKKFQSSNFAGQTN
jgi:undecaprenyl-diphosphatase